MDQYEEELEQRLADLQEMLNNPTIYVYLTSKELDSIESDALALEERLYQYRLKKELDGRIQVHKSQEPSV